MFFSMEELHRFWGVNPMNILHVGAHKAEEFNEYNYVSFKHLYWVEAQDELAERLTNMLDPNTNTVIKAAAWSQDGLELEFRVANNSESSSLYHFGTHQKSYPNIKFERTQIVVTRKLDSIFPVTTNIDFINLDIQGAELQALKGFEKGLLAVKWIYCEVNSRPVYKEAPVIKDIDEYLSNFGFVRKSVRWWKRDGWGDALYIHASVEIPKSLRIRIFRHISQLKWNLEMLARIVIKR